MNEQTPDALQHLAEILRRFEDSRSATANPREFIGSMPHIEIPEGFDDPDPEIEALFGMR